VAGLPAVRVFLSAHHTARRWALPPLVQGFEADLQDGATEVEIQAAYPPDVLLAQQAFKDAVEAGAEHAEDPGEPDPLPVLVARPTGKSFRHLPWWEVRPR